MAGTIEGGRKAAITNKMKYGDDFYRGIGHKGGSKTSPAKRWWALHPELAKAAGAKGGAKSKRGKAKSTLAKELSDALRELREATANGKEREEANA